MRRSTHERSKGVAGCEDPPIVWAKLASDPLFTRGFPSPALPIGIAPKAHVDPLLAEIVRKRQHIVPLIVAHQSITRHPYPSFQKAVIGSRHFDSEELVEGRGSHLAGHEGIEVRQLEYES